MQNKNQEVNILQAEFCAAVGEANRVQIIYELGKGPQNVKNLAASFGLSPFAASRHLKVLRAKDLVSAWKDGTQVIYSLAAPELIEALDIFFGNTQSTVRTPRKFNQYGKVQ